MDTVMDERDEMPIPAPSEEERDKSTAEFIEGVKERDRLKTELENTTRELNKVKGQNYDLLKRIDKLENEIKELTEQLNAQGKKPNRPSSGRHRKPSNLKKRPVKRKEPKKGKVGKNSLAPGTNAEDDPFENPDKLYEKIAELYPDIPLSTVLLAEKKFAEADVNGDGAIDDGELEKLLDSSDLLFTKEQVKQILKQVDTDDTGSVDFFECLGVLDLLRSNRKTGLPQSIQQNKSSVCTIQ